MTNGSLLLTNAVVVLPDRVIEGGTVAVEAGRIAAIEPRSYPVSSGAIDLDGRFLLPGIVDLHSDGFEREIAPRPGGDFDPLFALAHYDRKLAAAGVTTQFHGIYFANQAGFGRSVEHGIHSARAVHAYAAAPHRLIEHRVLHRLDIRTPGALDGLLTVLDESPVAGPELVSPTEHVPGQGQYWDLNALRRQIRSKLGRGLGDAEATAKVEAEVERRVRHAAETDELAVDTLHRVAAERQRRGLILASHDDDSPERVELMHEVGCRLAEFPLNLAAAEHVRRVGMLIAAGAPNLVRGTSLAGNASALDLVRRGLVDVLVADYHAPSLLAAVFKAVDEGVAALPDAVRFVTANPAAVVELGDRGRIKIGKRADLIAVRRYAGVPLTDLTVVGGSPRLATNLPIRTTPEVGLVG